MVKLKKKIFPELSIWRRWVSIVGIDIPKHTTDSYIIYDGSPSTTSSQHVIIHVKLCLTCQDKFSTMRSSKTKKQKLRSLVTSTSYTLLKFRVVYATTVSRRVRILNMTWICYVYEFGMFWKWNCFVGPKIIIIVFFSNKLKVVTDDYEPCEDLWNLSQPWPCDL